VRVDVDHGRRPCIFRQLILPTRNDLRALWLNDMAGEQFDLLKIGSFVFEWIGCRQQSKNRKSLIHNSLNILREQSGLQLKNFQFFFAFSLSLRS